MKFIKNNWIVLTLLLFTLCSELLHMLFNHIPFNCNVNWDSPVYYLTSQFGLLNFWPALVVYILIDKKNKASKSIAFGLIIWNIKELIDEVCYMIGVNSNVLEINSTFWLQLSFILTVVFFSALFFYKWKY